MRHFIYGTIILLLCSELLWAQRGTLNGRVIDAETKAPLVGANVRIEGSQRGAAAGADGRFSIASLPVGVYRLRVDYIGYETAFKTDIIVNSAGAAAVLIEMREAAVQGETVTVTAGYFAKEEQVQPSTIGLSREEIRRFPGGFEDVVRTVSALPGVAINNSQGRNDLLVRGGGPSENLYLINGIEVPNINHFGTQGFTGGSLSFVNLDFVEDVSFSTGGFGVRYGDKMSSVIDLSMRQSRPESMKTKLTVSATQFGADAELPLGRNGGMVLSARRSYLDLIFKAAGLPFIPQYTDFNIIADINLTPRDQLFIIGLSAIDKISRDQSTAEKRSFNASILGNSQYTGITGVRYRRLLARGYVDVIGNVTLSRYKFRQVDEAEEEYFRSNADEWERNLKVEHVLDAGRGLSLRSGLSAKFLYYDSQTTFADTIYDRSGNRIPLSTLGVPQVQDIQISGSKTAAYVEASWRPSARLELATGLRAEAFSLIDADPWVDPRLSIRYRLTEKHSLRLSGGVYHQSPSAVWTLNPANRSLKPLQNRMMVAGWESLIRPDLRLTLELYRKAYSDLPTGMLPGVNDYLVLSNAGGGYGGREDDFQSFGYAPFTSAGTGLAYGAELLLQKRYSEIPVYGLMSLSYNKGTVTAANGLSYPGQFDQRWIFNLSGGYIPNAKWTFSAKFRVFSGIPYTPVYRPSDNPLRPGFIQNLPEEYLSKRLDTGHHLDLRVDRFFNFAWGTLIVYVDLQNVYNVQLPRRPTYDFWEDKMDDSASIGILPSIGISVEW